MADFITRAKNIVANIKSKDLVIPGNPFLKDIAAAFIFEFERTWVRFLSSSAQTIIVPTPPSRVVVNPTNKTDPTDIGILDENQVFTAATSGDKNSVKALFFVWNLRELFKSYLIHYRKKTVTLTSGDAGETIEKAVQDINDNAEAESLTELGDPSNDPEV